MAEADEEGGRRGEGFLARWSRRKRGVAAGRAEPEAAAPEPHPTAQASAPSAPPTAEPATAEPEVDLASLPRVEDLTAESDITVFLRKGVPASLRNAALRRAWTLDPTIRDFIGPADYAWDWNVPGATPGYAAEIASGPDVEALADRILGLVRDRPGREDAEGPGAAGGEPPPSASGPDPAPAAPPSDPIRRGEPPPPAPPAVASVAPLPMAAPADDAPAPTGPKPARPRHGGAVPS